MTDRSKMLEKRNPSLDIIRIVAVFSVMSVHFFLYNGFYSETVSATAPMIIMCIMRSMFNVCVPLFMILTGYLMSQKTLSAKYYSGIKKTLVIYVLTAISCMIYKIAAKKATYTVSTFILGILDFSGAQYSWYIEMYIGLFLIIPFLNVMYNKLESKKQKQILVVTMIALAILPSLFNIWNFESVQWWASPITSDKYSKLIPAFWTGIYPIAYYFTGCYLREYGLKIKTPTCAVMFIALTAAFGMLHFWRSYGKTYVTGSYGYWNGFEAYILSLLLFVLLSRINCKKAPKGVKWTLWKISDLALSMYLVSYIFDSLVYPKLTTLVPVMQSRLPYYFVTVPIVFVCSLVLSVIINLIAKYILQFFSALPSIIKKLKKSEVFNPQNITFLVLFGGVLAFALWKCQYGFGGNDEAFYLTIPQRIINGDALFTDEWHLSQLSGIFLVPFVWLYQLINGSSVGIIFAARLLYVVCHAAVAAFIYFRLKKYGFAAAASILYFIFTPFNIMAYSYNTLSLDFIVITGLLMSQSDVSHKAPFIIAGITYAASVLCCPYFAAAYAVYIICVLVRKSLLNHGKNNLLVADEIFSVNILIMFTIGVLSAALLFLIFLFSRTSIADIFNNLPLMMKDPEHSGLTLGYKVSNYFKSIFNCHPLFKAAVIAYGVQIFAMIFDRRTKNHRAAYLIISAFITLFSLVLFIPNVKSSTYNHIMFPLAFTGLTAYILCDKKPKRLMAMLFIPGMIYSFAVCMGSNQFFYVISMAFATVNIASVIFIGQLLREMRERPDDICYGKLMRGAAVCTVALAVGTLGILQIKAKADHCFWETGEPETLTYKMQNGVAKGIYTNPTNGANYDALYFDLNSYFSDKQNENVLMLTEKTWCYLAAGDVSYGTFSAWISGENETSVQRLNEFYEINPDKSPVYVYIPKDSKWNFANIYNEATEKGYSVQETALSYRLEKLDK